MTKKFHYKQLLSRDEMIVTLKEKVCRVVFKKVNGEERDMICTLQADKINYESKGTETQPNKEVIRVWDVNKEAFRSFKVDNVTYFAKEEKYQQIYS